MASLLEVLIVFISIMLVLSLVAHALALIVDVVFPIRSITLIEALKGLVVEAATSEGLLSTDAQGIWDQVKQMLRRWGQRGVRKAAIRLDYIDQSQLGELIRRVVPQTMPGLRALTSGEAQQRLDGVARRAEQAYDISTKSVTARYRRRLRVLSLWVSFVVVLALNADAFAILQRIRADPAYRAAVATALADRDTLDARESRSWLTLDTLARGAARALTSDRTQGSTRAVLAKALLLQLDSVATVRRSHARLPDSSTTAMSHLIIGQVRGWRVDNAAWWLGIILSTLLVSLGPRFLADVSLSSLLGKGKK